MTNVRPSTRIPGGTVEYAPRGASLNHTKRNIILIAVALVLAAVSAFGIYSWVTGSSNSVQPQANVTVSTTPTAAKPDTGVQACQTMAISINQNHALGANAPHSDAELTTALKPFNSSQYTDLKTAGTNALTAILAVNKAVADDNTSFGDTLALYSKAQVQWGVLQVSCGNHGATLPALPDNSKS